MCCTRVCFQHFITAVRRTIWTFIFISHVESSVFRYTACDASLQCIHHPCSQHRSAWSALNYVYVTVFHPYNYQQRRLNVIYSFHFYSDTYPILFINMWKIACFLICSTTQWMPYDIYTYSSTITKMLAVVFSFVVRVCCVSGNNRSIFIESKTYKTGN